LNQSLAPAGREKCTRSTAERSFVAVERQGAALATMARTLHPETAMLYRRLGRSGLQLSLLSLGSWVTYHNQVDSRAAREMLAAAMDAGVNFFDNAEAYARGQSEVVMGEAIRALKWPRLNYVVSTKFFWGLDRDGNAVNRRDTLNRKYLMQAIDGSLSSTSCSVIAPTRTRRSRRPCGR
jgi:Aldo/keto reductase family